MLILIFVLRDEKIVFAAATSKTVTVSPVSLCDVCGETLADTPCQHLERRTRIDIVFEKVVKHVDAEVKQCPSCDSVVKGQFPSDIPMAFGI